MAREGLEYQIMPATYHVYDSLTQRGIEGQFLISVSSDRKFVLTHK